MTQGQNSNRWVATLYPEDQQDEWWRKDEYSVDDWRKFGINVDLESGGCTVKAAVAQVEKCPTTGRFHLQAAILLSKRCRFNKAKQYVKNNAHIEHMRGTWQNSITYCTKTDTREAGPFFYPDEATVRGAVEVPGKNTQNVRKQMVEWMEKHTNFDEFMKEHKQEMGYVISLIGMQRIREVWTHLHPAPTAVFPEVTLTRPQQELWDILSGRPVKRRVIWCWSSSGCTGKSFMREYVNAKLRAVARAGPSFKRTLASLGTQSILWFDMPRSFQWDTERGVFGIWNALEQFSDGGLLQQTFGTCLQRVWHGHVVVSTNVSAHEAGAYKFDEQGRRTDGKLSHDRVQEIHFNEVIENQVNETIEL